MKAIHLVQLSLETILHLTGANYVDRPPWSFSDADTSTKCICSNEETDKSVKCGKDTALWRIGVLCDLQR